MSGERLAEELRRHICDEAPVWETEFTAGPGLVVSVSDAVTVTTRVIDRMLREARAAELETVADEFRPRFGWGGGFGLRLRDRAAALREQS